MADALPPQARRRHRDPDPRGAAETRVSERGCGDHRVVAFAVMIAIVVNAMLNTQQQQVKNLFQNVQYCLDHPKDPACDLSVASSP